MARTFEDIFEIILSNMDEIQPDGVISGDTRDEYEQKAFRIMSQVQSELMQNANLFSTYEIAKTRIDPNVGSFQIEEFKGTDKIIESSAVANAYHFEVNGPGTVYIEDYNGSWNTLVTEVVPSSVTTYTAYKGLLTPTSGASKTRIRFSGTSYYNYTNYALFEEVFADTARVPDYTPWVKYEMPSDFQAVDRIIDEFYPEQYTYNVDYKWEGYRDLYLSYNFTGNVRIVYKPIPIPITTSTQSLQIDDITAETVLADTVTGRILASENHDLANLYLSFSEEGKQRLKEERPPVAEASVTDVYGVSGVSRRYNEAPYWGGYYG